MERFILYWQKGMALSRLQTFAPIAPSWIPRLWRPSSAKELSNLGWSCTPARYTICMQHRSPGTTLREY